MSPRTSSPPPSYGPYDDIGDYDYYPSGPSTTPPRGPYFSNISQANVYTSQQSQQQSNITPNVFRNDITETPSTRDNSTKKNNNNKGLFTALLLRPLNIPRRVLSSSAVKCVSLMVLYSFCITTVCFILFVSYLLTFYDDARRLFRSSRVWAQLRNGVRERIAMMGDDWEEFLQKYFDQPWDGDVRNVHLGGNNNSSNNNNSSSTTNATNDSSSKRNSPAGGGINNNNGVPPTTTEGIPNPKDLEWEDWLKGAVFSFMTVVAGQNATNKFQNSFRGRPPTATTGGDAGRR